MCESDEGAIFPRLFYFLCTTQGWYLLCLEEYPKGVKLLRKGVIKRVDDGATIDIWNDPWLRRSWSRQPTVHG
jgi:hypothetical protein